jgi:hypothetical protein
MLYSQFGPHQSRILMIELLELNAIAQGDVELSVLAARHARSIWHRRVWSKKPS